VSEVSLVDLAAASVDAATNVRKNAEGAGPAPSDEGSDTSTEVSTMTTALARDIQVEQVMHHGFVGCDFETPVTAVARKMAAHRIHCVVGFGDVSGGDTAVWGVISDLDVVNALAAGGGALTAGEIAATEVVSVSPRDSLAHVAQLMREHGITHVVVVERSDRPVGIVSTLDLMRAAADDPRVFAAEG